MISCVRGVPSHHQKTIIRDQKQRITSNLRHLNWSVWPVIIVAPAIIIIRIGSCASLVLMLVVSLLVRLLADGELVVVLVQIRMLINVQVQWRSVFVLRSAILRHARRGQHWTVRYPDVIAGIRDVIWPPPLGTSILEPCLDLQREIIKINNPN